jgi:hypothetical protein
MMHCTHQPYNQFWAHSLPNGHILWQFGGRGRGGATTSKSKKPNVKLNILNEGYPLNNEGIAQIDKRL